ncbi:MAG: hypothetical protein Q9M89_04130 [Persephonella sp.]|nr:hypothetical protein [Persephonella sp.]
MGDIQESINNALPKPAISRAVNDAFGIPQRAGFLGNYWENLKQNFAIQSPTPEVPQVKLKYEGGALIRPYANKNPMIADSIKAQVYGVKLPQVEKQKFKFGKPIKATGEDGKPIWSIPKLNEQTGGS